MHIYYKNGGYARRLEESVLSDEALETGLPVNIWLDTDGSYREDFVGKTIRFQGDDTEAFNPRNLFRMTISRHFPALFENEMGAIELPDEYLTAVRDFVLENALFLEQLADEKLTVRMFAAKMKKSDFFEREHGVLIEMATLRKSDSGLPVNLWIDDCRLYIQGRHAKRIKFQNDHGDNVNHGNLYPMMISKDAPEIPKKMLSQIKLPAKDINAIKDFVKKNADLLDQLADEKIDFGAFLKNMKKSEFYENVRGSLLEMAVMTDWKYIPQELVKRTAGRVVDDWFRDKAEDIRDLKKIAFEDSLVDVDGPNFCIKFFYGFISSFHKYAKGDAKASGARGDKRWEFRVLHIVSNVPGAEGQWMRDDFADSDFDGMAAYERALIKKRLTGKQMVAKIVADFKLKKHNRSVLQICNDLIK